MTTQQRVSIVKRAKAEVTICVRSDGQLTLVIKDIGGDNLSHKMTGDGAEVGGAIVGWMIGDDKRSP